MMTWSAGTRHYIHGGLRTCFISFSGFQHGIFHSHSLAAAIVADGSFSQQTYAFQFGRFEESSVSSKLGLPARAFGASFFDAPTGRAYVFGGNGEQNVTEGT
jgi:hypothetical protein